MSRYQLDAFSPSHEVIVGWDPAMFSFFAMVLDNTASEASDAHVVLQIGQHFNAVDEMTTVIKAVRPYAHIPDDLQDDLWTDSLTDSWADASPTTQAIPDPSRSKCPFSHLRSKSATGPTPALT